MKFPTGGIVREPSGMNRCNSGTDSGVKRCASHLRSGTVWMREDRIASQCVREAMSFGRYFYPKREILYLRCKKMRELLQSAKENVTTVNSSLLSILLSMVLMNALMLKQ